MSTLRVLIAAAVAWAHPVSSQTPVFRTGIVNVRVDALVTESGHPARGLTATDFEVFDSGVRQRVEHAALDTLPIDLVLAFDVSGSVAGDVLNGLRTAGTAAVAALRSGDRAALVTFNHRVGLALPLIAETSAVQPALAAMEADGGTSLVDAVYSALWVSDASQARGVAIVFSDGVDTSSWLPEARVVDTARRRDVVVYGVRTRRASKSAFLDNVTEATGGRMFDVTFERLEATFETILQEFRDRYVLSYSPTGVVAGGWHSLDVRVRGHRATVKARPGYLAGPG